MYASNGASVGLASVPVSLDDWVQNNAHDLQSFESDLQNFAQEDGKSEGALDVLGIGTSYRDVHSKSGYKHRRELLIYIPQTSKLLGTFDNLRDGLEANEVLRLKTKDNFSLSLPSAVAYNQKNSDATRKQYMPALLSIIESIA